jgi:hypothetical protein
MYVCITHPPASLVETWLYTVYFSQDGLLCRVYYATQFQKLRHMLVAPLSANPHITDEFAAPADRPADHKPCCDDKDKDSQYTCLS